MTKADDQFFSTLARKRAQQHGDAPEGEASAAADASEEQQAGGNGEATPAQAAEAAQGGAPGPDAGPVADTAEGAVPSEATTATSEAAPATPKAEPAKKRSQPKARGKGTSSRAKASKAPKAEEKPAPAQPEPQAPAVGEVPELGLGRSLPPFEELPDVVRLEDDVFVRDEGKLLPADASVKMTFTMSVRERHRMREFARLNRISYVDVFRAGLQHVLGDEEA